MVFPWAPLRWPAMVLLRLHADVEGRWGCGGRGVRVAERMLAHRVVMRLKRAE